MLALLRRAAVNVPVAMRLNEWKLREQRHINLFQFGSARMENGADLGALAFRPHLSPVTQAHEFVQQFVHGELARRQAERASQPFASRVEDGLIHNWRGTDYAHRFLHPPFDSPPRIAAEFGEFSLGDYRKLDPNPIRFHGIEIGPGAVECDLFFRCAA